MNVRPQARPRPHDVKPAHPRPLTTVALAVIRARGQFYFHAVDGSRSWSGRIDAPNRDTDAFSSEFRRQQDAP